jgi:microsomal dipeptidase-like Zn-dependent dipeptidase
MKRAAAAVAVVVLALLVAVPLIAPARAERDMNRVLRPGPYAASPRARTLHERLLVADLHADTLLWDRDLLRAGRRGHVDVPRLAAGNVGIQAFTIVTKVPRDLNIERNDDTTDDITLLALVQRWPPRTWRSLRERALHQARRLDEAAARSGGALTVIRSRGDLDSFLARRRHEPRIVGGFLGIEGAHALEGRLAAVDELFEAGVRMMSPAHFFDTEVGGSAHGVRKGGLTDLGRAVIRRMEAKGMVVDLAHASARTVTDVLGLASRPVVVSHTGVRGTCDNNRNLGDEQLRGVARTGGVVGIGYWDTAVCGRDARAIARAIRHAVGVAGAEHVGLGSDFDGAVTAPFDTTGVVQVTDALLAEGLDEDAVSKIMGGNVVRVLRQTLP